MYASLACFYEEDPSRWDAILPYLVAKKPVSLRTLDYFIVTYSLVHNVHYPLPDPASGADLPFYVHEEYKTALRRFTKNEMDPFCRGEKVRWAPAGYQPQLTAVKQLNFFRWCIQHRVLDYVATHHGTIEADAMRSAKADVRVAARANTPRARCFSYPNLIDIRVVRPPDPNKYRTFKRGDLPSWLRHLQDQPVRSETSSGKRQREGDKGLAAAGMCAKRLEVAVPVKHAVGLGGNEYDGKNGNDRPCYLQCG